MRAQTTHSAANGTDDAKQSTIGGRSVRSSLAALWVRSPRSPRSFARTLSSLEGRQCRGRRAGPRAGRAVGTGRKGHVRGHVRSNFLIVHKSFPSHVPFSLTPLYAWRAAARTVVVPPITVFVFVPLRPRKKKHENETTLLEPEGKQSAFARQAAQNFNAPRKLVVYPGTLMFALISGEY